MPFIKIFLILPTFFIAGIAEAKDSRDLSETRLKREKETSFYCPIGRSPMLDSSDGWKIKAIPDCTFGGPLDTKINRLKLEAPILNPLLTLPALKNLLPKMNCSIENDSGNSVRFRMPNGESLVANQISPREMQDPLFHFNVIPFSWGQTFISIGATQAIDTQNFIDLAKRLPGNPLFWTNPHFEEEKIALPRLMGPRPYLPVNLLSKCNDGTDWKSFGGQQSVLLVGDLHDPPQAAFFRTLLDLKSFAWVGLEIPYDFEPQLKAFLETDDIQEENRQLFLITYRYPKNLVGPTQDILKTLKFKKIQIILIDAADSYFNFPFTDLGAHGLMTAMRNQFWANRLPARWQGTGVILGGLDHFLVTPAADFQNFALERFPGIDLGLIDPNEKCQP